MAIAAGDPEGLQIARHCEADGRLGNVRVVEFDFQALRHPGERNTCYQAKTHVMRRLSPFRKTVFLDADTVVVADFQDMFPEDQEIRLTHFCDWVSNGKMMTGRIAKWKDVAPRESAVMLGHPYPAVNTGVVGFSQDCPFLGAWEEMTARKRGEFIADEIAAQIIYPYHPHVIMPPNWNACPLYSWRAFGVPAKYGEKVLPVDGNFADGQPDRHGGPKIWHFHGQKTVKDARGRFLWLPWYERAVEENLAEIRSWTPGKGNKRLRKFLQDRNCWGPDLVLL